MSPDLLREAGEALYGRQWQSALAFDVGVSDRSMRRWASGECPVPDRLRDEVRELLRARSRVMAEVRRKLGNGRRSGTQTSADTK